MIFLQNLTVKVVLIPIIIPIKMILSGNLIAPVVEIVIIIKIFIEKIISNKVKILILGTLIAIIILYQFLKKKNLLL